MDLSTWLSTSVLVVCLVAAAAALRIALHAVQCANEAWDEVKRIDASTPKKEITMLTADVTELADALESVRASLHKLRARTTMRENREKNGKDPAPVNSEELKAHLRKDLIAKGRL